MNTKKKSKKKQKKAKKLDIANPQPAIEKQIEGCINDSERAAVKFIISEQLGLTGEIGIECQVDPKILSIKNMISNLADDNTLSYSKNEGFKYKTILRDPSQTENSKQKLSAIIFGRQDEAFEHPLKDQSVIYGFRTVDEGLRIKRLQEFCYQTLFMETKFLFCHDSNDIKAISQSVFKGIIKLFRIFIHCMLTKEPYIVCKVKGKDQSIQINKSEITYLFFVYVHPIDNMKVKEEIRNACNLFNAYFDGDLSEYYEAFLKEFIIEIHYETEGITFGDDQFEIARMKDRIYWGNLQEENRNIKAKYERKIEELQEKINELERQSELQKNKQRTKEASAELLRSLNTNSLSSNQSPKDKSNASSERAAQQKVLEQVHGFSSQNMNLLKSNKSSQIEEEEEGEEVQVSDQLQRASPLKEKVSTISDEINSESEKEEQVKAKGKVKVNSPQNKKRRGSSDSSSSESKNEQETQFSSKPKIIHSSQKKKSESSSDNDSDGDSDGSKEVITQLFNKNKSAHNSSQKKRKPSSESNHSIIRNTVPQLPMKDKNINNSSQKKKQAQSDSSSSDINEKKQRPKKSINMFSQKKLEKMITEDDSSDDGSDSE